ncbi:uncharacterized protein SAPINGB_P002942 [Magnusiomyces paraingens]|uniref:Uncharacterized protein n=1 Tax=Magnusiomyces paraingens TaxID=2606893 RepID=A0A5E8BH49_9ASCO|nr:uncharacterized protein SAPINGB_P002942 [Saprochaete ingens]VVT50974.1 unnamed protein product [Saprochaete ingens]
MDSATAHFTDLDANVWSTEEPPESLPTVATSSKTPPSVADTSNDDVTVTHVSYSVDLSTASDGNNSPPQAAPAPGLNILPESIYEHDSDSHEKVFDEILPLYTSEPLSASGTQHEAEKQTKQEAQPDEKPSVETTPANSEEASDLQLKSSEDISQSKKQSLQEDAALKQFEPQPYEVSDIDFDDYEEAYQQPPDEDEFNENSQNSAYGDEFKEAVQQPVQEDEFKEVVQSDKEASHSAHENDKETTQSDNQNQSKEIDYPVHVDDSKVTLQNTHNDGLETDQQTHKDDSEDISQSAQKEESTFDSRETTPTVTHDDDIEEPVQTTHQQESEEAPHPEHEDDDFDNFEEAGNSTYKDTPKDISHDGEFGDFDDFEEASPQPEHASNDFDDDFGDFDDFDSFDAGPQSEPIHTSLPIAPSIPCLSETDFSNSAHLQASIESIIGAKSGNGFVYTLTSAANTQITVAELKPSTDPDYDDDESESQEALTRSQSDISGESIPKQQETQQQAETQTNIPATNAYTPLSYFTVRSKSLWDQLAAAPSPTATAPAVTDWRRSAIRRHFFVSLGVPVDLDEVMPQHGKQKRLILPTEFKENKSQTTDKDSKKTTAETEPDTPKQSASAHEDDKKVASWARLAAVSDIAIENMTADEVSEYVRNLTLAIDAARMMQSQCVTRRDDALKDKATFEKVIESYVVYTQRFGKNGGTASGAAAVAASNNSKSTAGPGDTGGSKVPGFHKRNTSKLARANSFLRRKKTDS